MMPIHLHFAAERRVRTSARPASVSTLIAQPPVRVSMTPAASPSIVSVPAFRSSVSPAVSAQVLDVCSGGAVQTRRCDGSPAATIDPGLRRKLASDQRMTIAASTFAPRLNCGVRSNSAGSRESFDRPTNAPLTYTSSTLSAEPT